MRYGITGPDTGLSQEQERFVADTTLFVLMDSDPPVTEFWSGCAFGVDTIGINAAERARVPLIGFSIPRIQDPRGFVRNLNSNATYLIDRFLDELNSHIEWIVESAPPGRDVSDGYMKRNTLTVSKIERLLAFPRTSTSELRSGTWATVRRARDAGIEIWFYPLDGSDSWKESPDPVERMEL